MSTITDLKKNSTEVISAWQVIKKTFPEFSQMISDVQTTYRTVNFDTLTLTGSTNRLTSAAEAAKAGFNGLWNIMSAHPIMTIIAAFTIYLTIATEVEKHVENVKNTTEWLSESSTKVQESKSKLSSLNSELETTKSKIDELSKKQKLSVVDEKELETLKQTNAYLEQKIALEQANLDAQISANSVNYQKAYQATTSHDFTKDESQWWEHALNFISGGEYSNIKNTVGIYAPDDSAQFESNIQEYNKLISEYNTAQQEYSKALQDKSNGGDSKAVEEASKKIGEKESSMNEISKKINEYIGSLIKIQNELDIKTQEDYNKLSQETKNIYNSISRAQTVSSVAQAKNPANTPEQNQKSMNTAFNGIYYDFQFEAGRKSIEGAKDKQGNISADSISKLIGDSNTGVKEMYDYLGDVGVLIGDDTTKMGQFSQMISNANTQTQDLKNQAEKTVPTFASLMSTGSDGKASSFVTGIESYVEKFQKLQDALSKVQTGKITLSEKNTLFKNFPELTQYANNLSTGINNVINSMKTQVVKEFDTELENFNKNGATQTDIDNLTNYKNTILGIADAANSTKNALSNIQTVFSNLSNVVSSYNTNGYFTIENLETLSTTGYDYLQYLTYENGQLKINSEAYKTLVNAQIDEIETAAILQATSDLQSLEDETAAKQYLATANLELASSQMSAAEASFAYVYALKTAQGGSIAEAAKKISDNLNTLRSIYNTTRSQASSYASQIAGVTKATNDNTTAKNSNTSATKKATSASSAYQTALENEKSKLTNEKKVLNNKKTNLNSLKTDYENAQSAIESLIEWTEKYIKQIKNNEIKEIEKAQTAFDKYIEKQEKILSNKKTIHDYNKNISSKTSAYAKDLLALDIASLDTSDSGQSKVKSLGENLKTSQADLADYLFEDSIDRQETYLDELQTATDNAYSKRKTAINKYLDDEAQIHKDACKMIDNDNGTLYKNLETYCLKYTTTTKAELKHMWTEAKKYLNKYNNVSSDTNSLMNVLKQRIYDVDDSINAVSKSILSYENRITALSDKISKLKTSATDAATAVNTVVNGSGTVKNPLNTTTTINRNNGRTNTTNATSNISTKKGWYIDWQGKRFKSTKSDIDDAMRDIISQIDKYIRANASFTNPSLTNALVSSFEKDFGAKYSIYAGIANLNNVSTTTKIKSKMHRFAKGTKKANAGLAQINEEGVETLMRSTPQGDFVLMNQGDRVYNKGQTDTLYNFSNDPANYILQTLSQSDLYKNFIDESLYVDSAKNPSGVENITNLMRTTSSPTISITIEGDATQSTVNALKEATEDIAKMVTDRMIRIPLKNKFYI